MSGTVQYRTAVVGVERDKVGRKMGAGIPRAGAHQVLDVIDAGEFAREGWDSCAGNADVEGMHPLLHTSTN